MTGQRLLELTRQAADEDEIAEFVVAQNCITRVEVYATIDFPKLALLIEQELVMNNDMAD